MIDWRSVFFNSFWIVGMALLLGAFSYNYWLAEQENRRLLLQLSDHRFRKPLWFALVLIGIGLIGTSDYMWETVIWGFLTLTALIVLIGLFR